jgi:hypothetical protein
VALAVRKIYPHRIKIASVEEERSMQWGSDYGSVQRLLEGLTTEEIIENVIGMVECPL